MPVDSLTLAALVAEARPVLVGGRLTGLSQAERGVVSLTGRGAGSGTWHWRVDLRDGVARGHLSDEAVRKGGTPPWLQQIRKHVEGARIVDVTAAPWERVVRWRLAGRDSLGDPRPYSLIQEIVGRYSLVCLVDDVTGTIVASSRMVDDTMSRLRQIAAGLPYALPPGAGDRHNLDNCSDEELAALCGSATKPFATWVGKTFAGLGKERLAMLTAGLQGPERQAQLAARLAHWRDAWRQGQWRWTEDGEPRADVGPGDLKGLNAALDHHYQAKLQQDRQDRLRSQLQAQITNQLAKLQEQADELDGRWAGCAQAERLQQEAELLQGNLYRIEAGTETVTVEDYFDPAYPAVTLPLDPARSPAENVQMRFRQAQKALRQRDHLSRQRDDLAARRWELDDLNDRLAGSCPPDVLDDMVAVLLPESVDRKDRPKRVEPKPERYRSADGFTIFVGRSSRQNEAILHDLSRGNDLWLHAQNIPGAHVLVQVPKGTSVPAHTLEQAACLAAFFSKGRHSTHVPVVAVERRFVRQPRGAAPGFVHYTNESALWVDPRPEALPLLATDS